MADAKWQIINDSNLKTQIDNIPKLLSLCNHRAEFFSYKYPFAFILFQYYLFGFFVTFSTILSRTSASQETHS
jgi:hypothetical protein